MKIQGALLVFAKSPVAGQVKTRLIPDIGRHRETTLYKELLTRTLDTVIKTEFSEIQLWVSGNIRHQYFSRLKNKRHFKFYQQTGRDLGDRMFNAFESALSQYPYAVLTGSDCPSLSSADLQSAMTLLESGKEMVLGPAEDGGYYLIGLRKNNAELFSGIKWGEENVFSETCARAKKINFDVSLLPKRSDVDRVSDLHAYFRMKKQESAL